MAIDPISIALEIGSKLIDRWFPDPVAAADKKIELIKLQQSGDLQIMAAQSDINKIEAASSSTFVSGWRPFIGWICGAACAWNWVGLPVVLFFCTFYDKPINMKAADLTEMLPVLLGMLGLGGLRTIEKLNGASDSSNVKKG